jgi:hypothetical protein
MKSSPLFWTLLIVVLPMASSPSALLAGTPVDVHCPQACKNCDHETCIERTPIQDCVVGEKKVSKTTIHKQYTTIPEVRYKFCWVLVEKEVPSEYCKTVCEPKEYDHQYQVEHWQKQNLPCGAEQHCKTCETKTEKLTCQQCKVETAKTTIKVHYWSCVKVPYTVYRQVEKEVCVKQPRTEKVCVPVTRYVCEHCGGIGCRFCRGGAGAGDPSVGLPCIGQATPGNTPAGPAIAEQATAGPAAELSSAGDNNLAEAPSPENISHGGVR